MIRSLAIAAVGAVAIGTGGFALGGGFDVDDALTPESANWQHEVCSAPPGGGKSKCYPSPPPESGWVLDDNQLINPRLSPNQKARYYNLLVRLDRIESRGLDRIMGVPGQPGATPR